MIGDFGVRASAASRAEKLPGSSKPESLFTGVGAQIADGSGK